MNEHDYILPSTFRSRITVAIPITLQDAAGGISTTGFNPQFSTFAYVESLSATRATYYGIDLLQNGWIVKMRYNSARALTTGSVIEYGDVKMIVHSTQIATQPYKRFIIAVCVQSEVQ